VSGEVGRSYKPRCIECLRRPCRCVDLSNPRVIVTGSRDHRDRDLIWKVLDRVWTETFARRPIVVVHGAYRGADTLAKQWALNRAQHGVSQEPYPADWDRYGYGAGPRRNGEMVDAGAALCVAFPLGEAKGTNDCSGKARAAGIPVVTATRLNGGIHVVHG
jgi:hypothetical protein